MGTHKQISTHILHILTPDLHVLRSCKQDGNNLARKYQR